MTPGELAEARGAGYRLLSQLIRGPLTAELVAAAALDPRLATTSTLEDLASAHLAAFDQGAFPYAGVFLEPEPSIGGATATACADLWTRIGLPEDRWRAGPGHLSAHLDALAWLCGAEADALQDGLGHEGARLRSLQRDVLDGLLQWLPLWVIAVADGWCGMVATATGELVVHHRLTLGDGRSGSGPAPELPDPSLDLDLADPATGVHEIAAFLAAPARCGLLLTARHITDIGRSLDTPGGFGPRRQRLGNLLRSAARFDVWPALVDALDAAMSDAATAITEPPWAMLHGVGGSAVQRLTLTQAVLRALVSGGADLAHER